MAESVSGVNSPTETFEGTSEIATRLRNPAEPLTVRELFEAGVHFGHQTKRWNPKMRQYIYYGSAQRHSHRRFLDQNRSLVQARLRLRDRKPPRKGGGGVLFVGTKRQAQEIVKEECRRARHVSS